MFEEMMEQIRFNITKIISFLEIKTEPTDKMRIEETKDQNERKKIPRNARCPCGSGKKFKHCHGKI